jgi:cytidylate kinase
MYKELYIVSDTEIKTLDLVTHTVNMDQERVARTIFESKPVGGRRMGRPKLRCLEDARK